MDRVAKYRAAGFTRPGAAPGHGVVVGIPVPVGFQACNDGRTGQPCRPTPPAEPWPCHNGTGKPGKTCLPLAMAAASSRSASESCGRSAFRRSRVCPLPAPDGTPACRCGGRQISTRSMDASARTASIAGDRGGRISSGRQLRPRGIRSHITATAETIRQGPVSRQMLRPDSRADDGDADHGPFASAMACACSANSITFKTMSLRHRGFRPVRTSAMHPGKIGQIRARASIPRSGRR
jgi:hypothetical protein